MTIQYDYLVHSSDDTLQKTLQQLLPTALHDTPMTRHHRIPLPAHHLPHLLPQQLRLPQRKPIPHHPPRQRPSLHAMQRSYYPRRQVVLWILVRLLILLRSRQIEPNVPLH